MIQNIQVLRALAALLVVFVHLKPLLAVLGARPFGGAGVDLFFVISGFIMVHTTRTAPPSAIAFLKNRVSRVVPLYWLFTLVVCLISATAPSLLQTEVGGIDQIVKSLLFIPFRKASGLVQPILFLGWTLNYEMFFYVLFALGLCFRNYASGLTFCASCLAALTCAGWIWPGLGLPIEFYTSPVLLEFAMGMALALLTDAAPRQVGSGARAVAAIGLLAAPALPLAPLIWPAAPQTLVSGVGSTVLVASAVLLERWGWSIRNAMLLAVGDASYALYLSHPFVTQTVQKVGSRLHLGPVLALALLGGCLALVIAAALAIHYCVERPLSRRARRVLGVGLMPARPA